MHVVLPGVGLGSVCVAMAAGALSASSSVSGGHAWEPLQTCGAGGYLQRGQLGVELPHPGLDSWLVEKRLAVQRLQVVSESESPCHADAWLLSPLVSRRQFAPADEF